MQKSNDLGVEFMGYLSGANHELFHSNLLAFFAKYEPEYFRKIFSLPDDFQYNHAKVYREKNKFDLSLVRDVPKPRKKGQFMEETVLVLENKFKSLPSEKQLKEYHEKVTDTNKAVPYCHFILLSLLEPSFKPEVIGWAHMDYGRLVERMTDFKDFIKGEKLSYLKPFVDHYCNYIRETLKKIHETKDSFNGELTVKQWDFIDEDLQKHQLERKINYILALDYIKNRLTEGGVEVKDMVFKIDVTHSTPVLVVYIPLNESENFFIQIQDHYIKRGFTLNVENGKPYTNRGKRHTNRDDFLERDDFLKEEWKKAMQKEDFKAIEEALKEAKSEVNLGSYLSEEKKKGQRVVRPAFIYEKQIIPYIRESLKEQKDSKIQSLLDIIAKELIAIVRKLN